MALPTTYSVGTISVVNGSTACVGVGTAWAGKVFAGDFVFLPSQPLVPAVRVAADATDEAIVLAWSWPGSDAADAAYEVHITPDATRVQERTRRVLALLGSIANTGLGVDAIGEFADRTAFDGSAAGFAFLSTDGDGDTITDPVVFIKATATSGDWSDPIEFRGPTGPQGLPGIIGVWRGAYSGATAYVTNDIVRDGGSAWIALGATTGNAPPALPTTSNTWWDLVPGTGTVSSVNGTDGDVVLSSDEISDVGKTNKWSTAAEKAKLANITVTSATDLDAIRARFVELDAVVILKDGWDASAGSFPGSGAAQAGWSYVVTATGTVDGVAFTTNDRLLAIVDNASTSTYAANWLKLDYSDLVQAVAGLTGNISGSTLKAALAIAAGDVSGVLAQGKMAIYLPAASFFARSTSGAGSSVYDSGSNDLTLQTGDFDTSTAEYLQVEYAMPKSWDRGTVTARFYWTATGGSSTQTVRWTFAGVAAGDGDSLNVAAGTAVYVDDTWQANNSLHLTAETSAMTISGSPAAEDLVVFQVGRDVANDNMSGDARLIGVVLYITLNAATDA